MTWTPGGAGPALILNLGDGPIRQTLTLPSGATTLSLTLKPHMLEVPDLTLTWKVGDALWLRQRKKIPGAPTTETVALPPGNLTLEITTSKGTVASIKLRR